MAREDIFLEDEIVFDDTMFEQPAEGATGEIPPMFEPPIEPPKPAAKPKPAPTKNEEAASVAAVVASWKKSGLLPKEFEAPETVVDFKKALQDQIYAKEKEAVERQVQDYKEQLLKEKGYDEQTLTVAQNIARGASPETAQQSVSVKSLSDLEIEDDTDEAYENRVKLIRAMYKFKGMEDEDVEALVQRAQDTDTDLQKAKDAKSFLVKVIQDKIDAEAKAEEDRQNEFKSVADKFNSEVKSTIDSGDVVKGVNKDKFYSDLYEATENLTVPGQDGKPTTVKVSPWAAKLYNMGISITPVNIKDLTGDKLKEFLTLAHTILYGSSVQDTVEQGVEDELDKLLKARNSGEYEADDEDTFEFENILF
jgi:hypothetical protein